MNEPIERLVEVDRRHNPYRLLRLMLHKKSWDTDNELVTAFPRGGNNRVRIVFFCLRGGFLDEEIGEKYTALGLQPADPFLLAKANMDDPGLAVKFPNVTHWQDADGQWCWAVFYEDDKGTLRYCFKYADGRFCGKWWFAGIRE